MSRARTMMSRIPPSTQEMTTTASRDAVNINRRMFRCVNSCYCCCIISASERLLLLTVTAVETSISKGTSERQNIAVQIMHILITGLSCSTLMEFHTESTWGSQLHSNTSDTADMKKLTLLTNLKICILTVHNACLSQPAAHLDTLQRETNIFNTHCLTETEAKRNR